MAKKTKTMIAQVVIKSKSPKVPDFGLGKGVLQEQEITCHDDRGHGFKGGMFSMCLLEHEDNLINDAVEVVWKEKKHEVRRSKA